VALFVDADTACIRDRPSLEGTEVLGRLSRGNEVRVRESSGQWRKVWVPKTRQVGWVAHWLLSEVPPPGYRREIAYVADDGVSIRTGPGETYDRKGVLPKGVQVDILAYSDQWRKVRVPENGEWGWVAGWLLKSGGSGGGEVKAADYGEARWVGGADVNLRGGPDTSGEPLARLGKGTKVYLMTLQSEWAKVHVHEGPIGWVHRDLLKGEPIPGATGGVSGGSGESSWGAPRWVGVEQLYLRPGPDTENRPLAFLTKGKRVYIMYLQEEWAQVHVHGGDIGWVFRDYLRDTEPSGGSAQVIALSEEQQRQSYDMDLERAVEGLEEGQGIVLGTGTNVRSGPGTMFPVVATAGGREKLKVYGEASGWLKVGRSDGQDGWIAAWLVTTKVQAGALSAEKVPAPPSVAVTAGSGDPQGTGKRGIPIRGLRLLRPRLLVARSGGDRAPTHELRDVGRLQRQGSPPRCPSARGCRMLREYLRAGSVPCRNLRGRREVRTRTGERTRRSR
jgi:uncharacterized protein YgiM (DUF1202 family)